MKVAKSNISCFFEFPEEAPNLVFVTLRMPKEDVETFKKMKEEHKFVFGFVKKVESK